MATDYVGIAWYHEADFVRLREMCEDRDIWEDTYEEWVQYATKMFEQVKSKGVVVEKVYILPDEFVAWCAAQGRPLNASARSVFVSDFLYRRHHGKSDQKERQS